MLVSVNFVCDGTAPNNGKIQLLVEYVDPGVTLVADVNVYWGITDPNGVEFKPFFGDDPFPATNADAYLTPTPGQFVETLVDIPLGSDGKYVLGAYTIQLYMKDTELGNDLSAVYESGITYNVDFQTVSENLTVFGDAVLTASFNCATAEITATDSTSLDGYSLVTRVLRLTPPDVPGQPAPTPVVTAATTLTEVFLWNNANYQITLSVIRSYDQDDSDGSNTVTTTVTEMLTAALTLKTLCGTVMCDAAACLAEKITELEDLACDLGSWAKIPAIEINKAFKKVIYAVTALLYKECGDYNKAASYAASAGDCGCGCDGTTTATDEITPYTAP